MVNKLFDVSDRFSLPSHSSSLVSVDKIPRIGAEGIRKTKLKLSLCFLVDAQNYPIELEKSIG